MKLAGALRRRPEQNEGEGDPACTFYAPAPAASGWCWTDNVDVLVSPLPVTVAKRCWPATTLLPRCYHLASSGRVSLNIVFRISLTLRLAWTC
jgi:hypothetical protein